MARYSCRETSEEVGTIMQIGTGPHRGMGSTGNEVNRFRICFRGSINKAC